MLKPRNLLSKSTLNPARRLYLASFSYWRSNVPNRYQLATSSHFNRTIFSSPKLNEKEKNLLIKENYFTIPNALCVTRILSTPVLAYLVLNHNYKCSLALFVFSAFTDFLDGMIARQFPSQKSNIGSFLDPLADKFLVATLYISLTMTQQIPVQLTSIVVARDALLILASVYIRFISIPKPRSLSKFFDPSLSGAKMEPSLLSKVNTAFQLILIGATMTAPLFDLQDSYYFCYLWYLVAATTISSGLGYASSRNSYKFFTKT